MFLHYLIYHFSVLANLGTTGHRCRMDMNKLVLIMSNLLSKSYGVEFETKFATFIMHTDCLLNQGAIDIISL